MNNIIFINYQDFIYLCEMCCCCLHLDTFSSRPKKSSRFVRVLKHQKIEKISFSTSHSQQHEQNIDEVSFNSSFLFVVYVNFSVSRRREPERLSSSR